MVASSRRHIYIVRETAFPTEGTSRAKGGTLLAWRSIVLFTFWILDVVYFHGREAPV